MTNANITNGNDSHINEVSRALGNSAGTRKLSIITRCIKQVSVKRGSTVSSGGVRQWPASQKQDPNGQNFILVHPLTMVHVWIRHWNHLKESSFCSWRLKFCLATICHLKPHIFLRLPHTPLLHLCYLFLPHQIWSSFFLWFV